MLWNWFVFPVSTVAKSSKTWTLSLRSLWVWVTWPSVVWLKPGSVFHPRYFIYLERCNSFKLEFNYNVFLVLFFVLVEENVYRVWRFDWTIAQSSGLSYCRGEIATAHPTVHAFTPERYVDFPLFIRTVFSIVPFVCSKIWHSHTRVTGLYWTAPD